MRTQAEKGRLFRSLHEREGSFIIPNPWDIGSARLLARLGFEALATTSAGYAFSIGQRDNTVNRERMLLHARDIVSATELPVSADLENGFGDDPESVAQTVRLAVETGLAGCSIEDMTKDPQNPIYPISLAAERISAASSFIRSLAFPFTLTARAENHLVGKRDLKDTILRLQAYQEAGANVLYAPGLTSKEEIAELVRSVNRPVNVLMGLQGVQLSLAELSAMGVKRVSVGSALARAAYGAFLRAGREMKEHGTFNFANEAVSFREIMNLFARKTD
jgi:2-methylisocitrate lyase-like PEP mutase family enzyme